MLSWTNASAAVYHRTYHPGLHGFFNMAVRRIWVGATFPIHEVGGGMVGKKRRPGFDGRTTEEEARES